MWLLVLLFVPVSSHYYLNTSDQANCRRPLGMASGKIRNEQITVSSAFNNDYSTFGAHRARLNLTSWPPGYRADSKQDTGWIKVELEKKMVITAVATQGYGDSSVEEWISRYMVMFSNGGDFMYFKDLDGNLQTFPGNRDSYSIQRNEVALPVVANSIMIMEISRHNNFAMRMELYGCEPGYYFVVWLMMTDYIFKTDYLDSETADYQLMTKYVVYETKAALKSSPGFLSAKLVRFTPQTKGAEIKLTAELKIECIEAGVHDITAALTRYLTSTVGLFEQQYVKLQYALDYSCRPPKVHVLLNKSHINATKITTVDMFFVIGEFALRCNTSTSFRLSWDSYEVDGKSGAFKLSPSRQIVGARKLTIRPKSLRVGLYFIRLVAEMTKEEGALGYDYGFLQVVYPDLVAKIRAVDMVVKGTSDVVLDATDSYDPHDPASRNQGITFTWLCRREDEDFSNLESLPIDTSHGREKVLGGCFGYGVGKMNTTEPFLKISVNKMVSQYSYVFELIVEKQNRSSTASHILRVESSIAFSIRCKRNCGSKVTANKRMIIESECKGVSCQAIQKYNWTLFKFDVFAENETWVQETDLENRILTEPDSSSLVFKGKLNDLENSLADDTKYRLRASVYLDDDTVEESEIFFKTNSPPVYDDKDEMAGCSVTPEIGHAVTTEFTISCRGFMDKDMPLSYEFSYHTNTGAVVIQKGSSSSTTTRLPLGDLLHDYVIALEIQIIDSLGAACMDVLIVKVEPMPAEDVTETLISMTSGEKNPLGNLIQSGDVDKAAQMAYAVLSMVDKSEGEMNSKDKISIAVVRKILRSKFNVTKTTVRNLKDSIINQMTAVKVTSLEQVTQMAAVVAIATEQKDEISQSSQENALNLLEDTADFVSAQLNSDTTDPGVLQDVGASLLHGISNVISATSSKAKKETDDEETDEEKQPGNEEGEQQMEKEKEKTKAEKEKSKKMAEKTLKLMDKVGSSLLGTKAVGEKPSVFSTKSLNMTLDRQVPSKIGNKKLSDGQGDGGVELPSAATLFGDKARHLPSVDSQMLAFKDNPYTWDATSKNIKSSVIDFSLKAADGETLEVSGLSKPVELFIPQKKRREDKDNSTNTTNPVYFAKPSDGENNLRYHQVVIPSKSLSVFIEIKPEEGKSLEVYVSYKKRPTVQHYSFSAIIPDIKYCKDNGTGLNCSEEAYVFVISSAVTGHIGVHYIAIRYPELETESTSTGSSEMENDEVDLRVRRDCGSHGGRQKRSCIGVKDPPTTPPPTPKIVIPQYDNSTDVNYTLSVTAANCLYWSENKQAWTGDGCTVGPKTVSDNLHCLCTHLSAFGGDFFVAPNPIDFDKVWAEFGNLAESGNFVVLATVCSIFGLYFVGLVFARKADRKDEMKVVANVYLADNTEGGYLYEISIQTGMWKGYGTTANIGLIIYGEQGVTPALPLSDPELNKIFFARGSINNFTLSLPESLGNLVKIKIWHDNSGKSPAWFFSQVKIIDSQTGDKWHFLGNRWLALDKGTGQIEVELKAADQRELSGFKNLFYSRTSRSLGDGHLWLSVFTRPPHNTFTRCQRLTCCLSILFATLITNAMFYQFNNPPEDTFQLGPIKLSWIQIKIGIQSSLIAIPVNVLVVTIFTNIKYPLPADAIGANQKIPGCLPHFFVYVGWMLCILTSLASAAFTVFYSMMWGAETSNQWLTSIMVSFFQDVVITQPIKVVLIASLLSLIIRKPPEQDLVLGSSMKSGGKGSQVEPPAGEALKKAREFQTKVLEMFRTIIEMTFFFVFIALLMVVCYGNRKPTRFQLTAGLENMFSGFEKVNSPPAFWTWTRNVLIPELYHTQWYNGDRFEYEEGFLSNRETFMVGMPRLRQARIRPEERCIMEATNPELAHNFQRCLSVYNDEVADLTLYNQPGWIPLDNTSQLLSVFELQGMCPRPWRYRTAKNLTTLSWQGLQSVYGGGGFIADLGYNAKSALEVLHNLEKNNWINDMTAAVFVEFTIHQPATSLFSVVRYLFERLSTGGYNTVTKIATLTIYASPDPAFKSFYQLCQLLLMLVILFFFFAEIGKIYRQKCFYFAQFWNWMELLQIFGAVAAVVMFFFKEMYTSEYIKRIQANPFETSSTDYIVLWSELEIYLLAFVIFIVTIKFLRLIRFNRHICQMTATIQKSMGHLLSFFCVFVGIILAYTQMGVLVFGSSVSTYSSFFQSMRSVCQMILGGETHFHELKHASKIVGPLFVFCFMLSMSMIMLNMFLVILNESYEEVKDFEGHAFADAELGEFMKTYCETKVGYVSDELVAFFKKMITMARAKRPKMGLVEGYEKVPIEESDQVFEENVDDGIELCGAKPQLALIASMEDLTDSEEDLASNLDDVKQSLSEIGAELRRSISVLNEPSSPCDTNLNDLNKEAICSCEDSVLDPRSYGYNRYSFFSNIWERQEFPNDRFRTRKRTANIEPLISGPLIERIEEMNAELNEENIIPYFPTIWERQAEPDHLTEKQRTSSKPFPLVDKKADLRSRDEECTFDRVRLEEHSTPDLMSTSTINSTVVDDLPESFV